MFYIHFELILLFILIGIIVGIASGLLGIGGGGILVPTFTSIFTFLKVDSHFVIHYALGTSMACIVITSLSSLNSHRKLNGVLWDIVIVMAPGVIIGTFFATFIASSMSSKNLAIFFSIFMTCVAIQMLLNVNPKNSHRNTNKYELCCVSILIGAVSALVSIGGGSLTVPYLSWRNVEIRKAIGTSAALGFPVAVSGSIGYLLNGYQVPSQLPFSIGYIYLPAVLLVSIPSFFVAPIGARLAHQFPKKRMKIIFSILLLILSFKMLLAIF